MNTANMADFLQNALSRPPDAIGYAVSRALAEAFPGKGIVAAGACAFTWTSTQASAGRMSSPACTAVC